MADDTCPICGGPFGPFSGPHDCNEHLIAALRAQLEQARGEVERITADRDARREQQYAEMLEWRGISEHDSACKICGGSGRKTYGSTSTWRGGGGGQMMTVSVCDACWGSGMADKPWPSWRKTEATIARQREWIKKAKHLRKCSVRAPHAATMDYKPTCNCGYTELTEN